jgi:hypothetical protein
VIGIAERRLRAQLLVGEPAGSPIDVVRLLGAVQSQDYPAAKWALGLRTAEGTDAEIDRMFDSGGILRTHVLRPTWHFILPADARWLLALTGPRVRRSMAGRLRQLEMDDGQIDRATAAMADALAGGQHLTRRELGEVLRAAGIPPDGQRLPHFLAAAELAGIIVSGPRRGKQFTYALLAERAPQAGDLDREEALGELTRRYFRSHGPAQIQDFAWWSGLTVADIRAGIALVSAELERCILDGKAYWCDTVIADSPAEPVAHLLPTWDEYTVAYRDRAAALPPGGELEVAAFPYGILSNVVTIRGQVRGAWRRITAKRDVRLEIRSVDTPNAAEVSAIEEAVQRFGRFLEAPAELVRLT